MLILKRTANNNFKESKTQNKFNAEETESESDIVDVKTDGGKNIEFETEETNADNNMIADSEKFKQLDYEKIKSFAKCLNTTENTNIPEFEIKPENCSIDVDLVWLIKSSIYRNLLRQSIRKTWGQEINFNNSSLQHKM